MTTHNRSTLNEKQFKDVAEFEQTAIAALRELRSHIENSVQGKIPATGWAPIKQILQDLDVEQWIETGGMNPDSFKSFLKTYLGYSVKFHHPGYIAHQVSVPDYPAALAAIINGLTNNPMGLYEMGSAAASIEYAVINWMLAKVSWAPQVLGSARRRDDSAVAESTHATSGGVFTHGGSLANLTALLAARARIAPEAWVQGVPCDLAVLVPRTSHYSNARAISILGLGSNAIYPMEVSPLGVVDPKQLEAALDKVNRDGRRCMAVIANACSTATGLHDPLRAIGEFCQRHGLWFHADACHGATALLHPKTKPYLDGIELADSIVWDTHKMMQVPVLSAAVLLKNITDFDNAFHQEASYLAYGKSPENYDTIQRTVECTRSAMAFKVFLNLAWRGEGALGDYVHDRYQATKRFYHQICQRPGFECPYEPETNILCFRYNDDDALQDRIRDQLMRAGTFHISSTELNKKRYLRLTVMNKLTDENTIASLLDAIECAALNRV